MKSALNDNTISLNFRCKHITLSEQTRERLRLHLAAALGRLQHRIAHATASVADENGPKGGVDKRCRIVLKLRPRGSLTVQHSDKSAFLAFQGAFRRVKRSLARSLGRAHTAKRRRDGFAAGTSRARQRPGGV